MGRTASNLFQEAIAEVARRAGLRFILNVVLDHQKQVPKVAAGEPEETHRQLVEFARSIYEVPIPHRYDVVIGGAGFPKDTNLRSILDDARAHDYPPGQQRAFVMAKVLEQVRVVIVGSECPEVVAACKMTPAATMEEALALAARELGDDLDMLIVPHALLTLPVVQQVCGWQVERRRLLRFARNDTSVGSTMANLTMSR